MISIQRKIDTELVSWSKDPKRKVLVIRGARQVGKTYSVRKHSKQYQYTLEINFLSDKKANNFFSGDLNVEKIIEELSTYYGIPIEDSRTLIFFDEIQQCPQALEALRFFYEKRPALHVIATGSLLEFALSEIPSFGVGRIQSIFMHPVTFEEYLLARGEEKLISYLQKAGPSKNLSLPIHEKLTDIFKKFLFHGGLPEAVTTYLEGKDYQAVNLLIDNLRVSFEDDFVKYAKKVPTARLREVFRSVCIQAGRKFVHSHAYPDARAGQVHDALELLVQAGIVYKIYHSSSNALPLGGEIDSKKFKVIPFDHGIYQRVIGVTPAELILRDFDPVNKGAMAEVYAACALINEASLYQREDLHYWHREAKSSNAELDFVMPIAGKIIPIEVKAATKGKMQSMQNFLAEKKNSPIGIRTSLENFSRYENILVVPLYALSQLERLVQENVCVQPLADLE